MERRRHARKLLIASIGVAAVSYVACGGDDASPGSSDGGATGGGGGSVVDAAVGGSMVMDAKLEQAMPGFDVVVANLMSR